MRSKRFYRWMGVLAAVTLGVGSVGTALSGQSALFTAALKGGVEEVEAALADGAAINAVDDEHGWPALMYAAAANGADVVTALIAAGADVDQRNAYDQTPLIWAARENGVAVVEALLAAGADPNRRGKDGWTALMSAAEQNGPDVVTALIAAGADVDARIASSARVYRPLHADDHRLRLAGMTPLMLAAVFNRPAVVAVLLDAGADITVRSRSGKNAAQLAAEFNPAADDSSVYQRLQPDTR